MIKSPFKFLDSYSLEDRNSFFGRDQEITDLFRKVLEGKILLVYGISGTGKSSLVNCGLASKFDQSDWLPINVRRGSNIIDSLNEAVNRHAITSLKKTESFVDKIQSLYLDHFKPVFLIFDQFEELFIFGSPEEKKEFLGLIKGVVRSRLNCNVIFIIREEFLAGMTEFDYDLPEIFSNRYRVEKMKKANAISAVEGPCKVNGIGIEPGFSEQLINKLTPSGTDVELTYLQIYLDRILKIASEGNKETESLIFSNELLNRAGSVSDLLGQFLDEQIRQLDDPDTGMSILKSFVSIQGTKRQMNELQILDTIKTFGTTISPSGLLKCLTRFVDLRILRERDEAGHYELRHDSLASEIYKKFTAIEKDIVEVKQFIDNAYSVYEKRGKLLSADDLKYISPYEDKLYLNKSSETFIDRSKNEITRTRRRRRTFAGIAAIALIIVLSGFTIWAMKERGKAIALSHRSKVLLLVAKAREANFSNPTKAMRYAQLAFIKDSTNYLVNQTLIDIFSSADSKPFYAVSMGHSDKVRSAVFSPDGKSILTASWDKTAKLWDLSGKCLVTLSGHSSYVNSAAFSADGKYILTASADKTAKLWDLSGNCIVTLSGHSDIVTSAVFSADGKYILTASDDKTAKLWDLSGNCIVTLSGHSEIVTSAVFSADGKYMLTASLDKTVKMWDLSGKCIITLLGHSDIVTSAVFSADGKSILTASGDKTAKLWDLSGKCMVTFSGHSLEVWSTVFSPDGKSILTASIDKTAKLWDLSGKCLATLSGHSDYVSYLVFSADGKYILTASGDKTAKLWDLSGKCLVTLSGHSDNVRSTVFSADGKYILTASADKTAKLWNLSGKSLVTLSGHSDNVRSAVFSADGKYILTASADKTAKLWDLSGKCLVTLSGHSANVYSAVFSPDGKYILTASLDNTAKLWDLSGKCLVTLSGHSAYVYSAVFSPDDKYILTASWDKTAKLWDLSGKCLVTLSGHSTYVNSAVFSADGKYILTASLDNTAKLWDLSGKCLATLSGHSAYVYSAVFCPDGKSILTASWDKRAKLWDLSGKCLATLSGHSAYVNSAVFSADGKYILTASDDKTAKLWDLSGKCIVTLSGHSAGVSSAIFSPNGKYLLTASEDKTAKLWDLSGKCVVTFSGHSFAVNIVVFSPDGRSILTASMDRTAKLWFMPSSIIKWLSTAKIGLLSPVDKAEIDELDDFKLIQQSDNLTIITDYADWYLEAQDTTKAISLYLRAMELNPMSIDKKILGDIYRKLNKKDEYSALYKDNPELILKDDINALQDTSSVNNYTGKYNFYSEKANLYEQLIKIESSLENKINTAGIYNDAGWYGLFSGNYNEALKAIQRGIELDPSNEMLYTNLPLCYLFTSQFEKAKSVYLEFKNKVWTRDNNAKTFREVFLSDIASLEKEGISLLDFAKVKELLQK